MSQGTEWPPVSPCVPKPSMAKHKQQWHKPPPLLKLAIAQPWITFSFHWPGFHAAPSPSCSTGGKHRCSACQHQSTMLRCRRPGSCGDLKPHHSPSAFSRGWFICSGQSQALCGLNCLWLGGKWFSFVFPVFFSLWFYLITKHQKPTAPKDHPAWSDGQAALIGVMVMVRKKIT